ncbi:hypothetical protein OG763_15195 [Streptomyces sp. NBC_01230]|uniref:hypothetical protein n=1 Tax=Streptomyces sp. NBC_01230 TaxID=2903784 RepID=UPI002E15BAE0|nr:hypothetical protein OG763_15195 [Streptomyces sp. NBC_01230]
MPFGGWGKTASCGCLRREVTTQRSTTHGYSYSSEYRTWGDMVARCTNPNHKRWADYGGRGITVCDRWKNFANFLADMGERPVGRELDRIDNNRGYEPDNCRWTDRSTQQKNRPSSAYAGLVRDPGTGQFRAKGSVT